jgi:hypothetical protein
METSELLRRAWKAVEESEVPEFMQEAAFREAVEHLRSGEGAEPSEGGSGGGGQRSGRGPSGGTRGRGRSSSRAAASTTNGDATASVDEGTFFSRLSDESGVPETDLRDVLSVSGGNVRVTPATRLLGTSKAEQARTVVALVTAARA